ncbi:hypothetical protein EIL87_12250 [Saccharopolyspora rhizosphaerae]|uniref:Uncharacterized protein n=1 Tax=Saccharopolyspora rhizosphaerae TaxID=2492662 RepID=A0A426JV10_9PSEU|nr:hypothetical protein [Saccharopolyspora rhizosphaerae]RRO17039.1 hypothetical protein EIL87_12250 [Saccharopolyspora rhizosphaerae]
MIAFYILFGVLVVMPWSAVIADLPLVRQWWATRRARRTTRQIWARHPEARPTCTNEHLPAPEPSPLDRGGQAMYSTVGTGTPTEEGR